MQASAVGSRDSPRQVRTPLTPVMSAIVAASAAVAAVVSAALVVNAAICVGAAVVVVVALRGRPGGE